MQISRIGRLVILSLGCYLCFSPVLQAQSGRRANQPSSPAPPPVTSQPESTLEPEKLEPHLKLLVAREPSSKRLPSEDAIYASFLNRLNEVDRLAVESLGNLKQADAVKRAKAETASFVVLLQFEIDSFQRATILLDSPDLEIKYLVFAPVTGKRRSRGKLYYQSLSGPKLRRDTWPKGPPIKITTEAAGIEAAELLLEWIGLELRARKLI
jgi:hypothetical protein